MHRPRSAWALVALGCLVACGDREDVDLGGDFAIVVSVPPLERRAIDVLFVIDDSGSVADDSEQIAAKAQEALFDVIEASIGGAPDLHIGIVTSSMTIEGEVDGCGPDVGNGRLTTTPRQPDCVPPTGSFIVDVAAEGGGRTTNYAGTLSETLACLLPPGTEGCGFEQPLAAAMRAVSGTVPENDGFLRPEALLVVIFLADEDDCTSIDPALYDPSATFDPALGPPTSYRCFQHMIACDQPLDVPGSKSGCHPAATSAYALPLGDAADALIAAKGGDASLVFVATIAGATASVSVTTDLNDRLQLESSCGTETSSADPAIRLHGFLDRFPARSWSESLCTDDLGPTLRRTAEYVGDVASRRGCLRGGVIDYDPAAAGIQPRCRVYASTAVTREAGESRALPSCETDDGDGACSRIVADGAACVQTGLGLRVEVDPRGEDLGGSHIIAECKTR